MNHQIVKIKWIEAGKFSKLSDLKELNLSGAETVGFVIQDTENAVLISQSLYSGSIENAVLIPKTSIIEIQILQIESKKEEKIENESESEGS